MNSQLNLPVRSNAGSTYISCGSGMVTFARNAGMDVFRFNRRKAASRGLLFYRLLETAMHVPPTTQDELLGHKF